MSQPQQPQQEQFDDQIPQSALEETQEQQMNINHGAVPIASAPYPASQAQYYNVQEQIKTWSLQVKIWSIILAMLSFPGSFITARTIPVSETSAEVETQVVFMFNPLSLLTSVLFVITSAAGVVAGFKKNIRAAKVFSYGLILSVIASIAQIIISGSLEGYQALIKSGSASAGAVVILLVSVVVCGLGIGVCCNLPCFACFYCGYRYYNALQDEQAMKLEGAGLTSIVVPPVTDIGMTYTQVELPPLSEQNNVYSAQPTSYYPNANNNAQQQ